MLCCFDLKVVARRSVWLPCRCQAYCEEAHANFTHTAWLCVCQQTSLSARGRALLHPDRFISPPFVCLFYSTVYPHTETWNKHIRSIKIIPWRRCTKAIYKSFKGPLNLKTPSEWHGADAYGLHVIIMGMHYKNKATDECVKSKINPIFITLTTVSYTSSNDMHLDS